MTPAEATSRRKTSRYPAAAAPEVVRGGGRERLRRCEKGDAADRDEWGRRKRLVAYAIGNPSVRGCRPPGYSCPRREYAG
jgi:hypothetical protein